MDCFLCQNPSAKFLCLSNNKTNEESTICEKCSLKSKSYCSTCGKLDNPLSQIWDQNRNPHCKSCFKQTLCPCGIMSVIVCSCNHFLCRQCSIKHFCSSLTLKNHNFTIYQEIQITPDPDFIDSNIGRCIPNIREKIANMQGFYLWFHTKFQDTANIEYFINSYSLYRIGYPELAKATIKSSRNKIPFFISLELQSYFDPEVRVEDFDLDELAKFEFANELDRIRIKTLVKHKKLEKKDRKNFSAKKLKYAIFNNLCPSFSLLKAITIYFETTRNEKYLDLFIDYVTIHFQGCFELGRLYYVKALNLYKQSDYTNSDKCFKKSLEIMNHILYISSPLLNTMLFHYAKNLNKLGRINESLIVLMRILKLQNLDENKSFIKKILTVVESFNETSKRYKDYIQGIKENYLISIN